MITLICGKIIYLFRHKVKIRFLNSQSILFLIQSVLEKHSKNQLDILLGHLFL